MCTDVNAARATVDIKCNRFMLFFYVLQSAELKERLLSHVIDVKAFFLWFLGCPTMPCPELGIVMSGSAAIRKQTLKCFDFGKR